MSNQEPFRSRPHVTRRPKPDSEDTPSPSAEPDEPEVVEGVLEEDEPRQLLAAPAKPRQAIALPVDYDEDEAEERTSGRQVTSWGLLLIATGLTIGGVFITLLNVADLPDVVEKWWPMVSLIVALLWSFGALLRRNAASFLGGATVVGLSLSLLLDSQDIATFEETVVGIILMTFGLAIVMRGLLLRSVQT